MPVLALCLIIGLSAQQPTTWRKTHSLIGIIRERLVTAEAVARAKHNSGQPVEDKARERAVVFNAIHMGVNMGVDADLTLRVFTAQIEASKIAQRAFLTRWQDKPRFANALDLATTVRPILDRLTPEILQELKAHQSWPKNAVSLGPSDPAYRVAWRVAIGPIRGLSDNRRFMDNRMNSAVGK